MSGADLDASAWDTRTSPRSSNWWTAPSPRAPYRDPTGHLIRQLLNEHSQKPLFVVVRPHAASKPPLVDLAELLSAHAGSHPQSHTPSLQLGRSVSVGSGASAPTWQPASLSPFPDGATTPWESVSSGQSNDPQVRTPRTPPPAAPSRTRVCASMLMHV